MKINNKMLFLVLLISLFSFTGCQKQLAGGVGQDDNKMASDQLKKQQEENKRLLEESAPLLKLQDRLNVIVAEKNIEKCKELEHEAYLRSCQSHILANQAVEEKNPEICQDAEDPEVRRSCQSYYDAAQQITQNQKEQAKEGEVK